MRPCGFSPDPADEDQIAAFLAPYAALLVDNVNQALGHTVTLNPAA